MNMPLNLFGLLGLLLQVRTVIAGWSGQYNVASTGMPSGVSSEYAA